MNKRAIILILLALVILGYFLWDYNQKMLSGKALSGSGTIQTTNINVGSRVGGRISAVKVSEGDMVHKGQVLVELEPYQLPSQKAALVAQLSQAQARLLALEHGARPQEIAAAQAQYGSSQAQANLIASGARQEDVQQAVANRRQAEADLANAQANYQRFQVLLNRKVISQQEFDTVNTTYQTAREKVNALQEKENELKRGNRPQEIVAAKQQAQAQLEQLRLLKAGSRVEDIAAQQAIVQSIQAQIEQENTSLKELNILSPCDCQISSMDLKPGLLILSSQSLATLINLNDLWVRVYIPEEDFGKVQPGDAAIVNVDAYPNEKFVGHVVQIASRAEFTPRNVQTQESRKMQVFGVKVALNNNKNLLRAGMPVDVIFDISKRNPPGAR